MDWASRAGLLVFLAVSSAVGSALLVRGLHRRALPELALGGMMVLGGPLGYAPMVLAWSGSLPPALLAPVQAAAHLGLQLSAASLLLFNVRVFRPESSVARALAGAAGLAMAAAWVALLAGGAFSGLAFEHRVWQADCAVRAFAYVWAAGEAFREHALCRRRVRLGLAEPAVADRFLLWGLLNVGIVGIFANFLYGRLLRAGETPSALWYWTDGALALATAVAVWLAFAPPAAYLRRRARHAS